MRLIPKASKVIDRQDLRRAVRTLAYGTVGGAVFYWFNMPLAWMMGAMVATTVMSMNRHLSLDRTLPVAGDPPRRVPERGTLVRDDLRAPGGQARDE